MPSTTSVAEIRRALSRHRALLAAGLAAGAVASALTVLAPSTPTGVAVLVAAHDLAAGTVLAAGDLRRAELPRGAAPTGVFGTLAAVVGRQLAAPLRRGEPLTDVRLAGPALLPPGTLGLVATPVRIADGASASLVTSGDRVDVLAAATTGRAPDASVVAADAEVLAVPTAADSGEGALVLLATTPQVASRLAAAAVSSRLSLTVRPRR